MKDHSEALATRATERYLLDEMSVDEREKFEDHYFSCSECANDVKLGAMFVDNAGALLKEHALTGRAFGEKPKSFFAGWKQWTMFPAPAMAACAALVAAIAYQNMVQIPALRQGGGTDRLVVARAVQLAPTRDAASLNFSKAAGTVSMFVRHAWEKTYPVYVCEVKAAAGEAAVLSSEVQPEGSDFTVSLPARSLAAGKYTLNIYGTGGGDAGRVLVARFPFTLTD